MTDPLMGKLLAGVEEIRGVTYGLDGPRLDPWQAAQRLYKAGFTELKTLAKMWAVLEYESGRFLRAWHHNVQRTSDGQIQVVDGKMTVMSTDMGYIQRNVAHSPVRVIYKTPEASAELMAELWEHHPNLARGDYSAELAKDLYDQRGFDPWYAYKNGNWRKGLGDASLAVGNLLDIEFIGTDGHQVIRKKS